MNILLVDDERYTVEGLISMLDWKKFEGTLVGTASNGRDAMNFVSLTPPDIIITDIKMPVMDGLELAKEISLHAPKIKLIILSAHGEFDYAKQALQYGVTDYILKPVTRQKLHNLEDLLCRLNHERKEQKRTYLQSFNPFLQEEIMTELRQCNLSYFDEFFSSDDFVAFMKSPEANTLGTQLLNYLYLFFDQLHISATVLDSSKTNTLSQFYDLPNTEEKINFIITMYNDILSFCSQQRHSNTDTLVHAAREYIEDNYSSSSFSISSLADYLNVSISYLSTFFKQSTSENLSTYLTGLRMEKAKLLLNDVQYPISEVARRSGYEDAKYFAKYFKKHMDMTPSEYRNLCVHNRHKMEQLKNAE